MKTLILKQLNGEELSEKEKQEFENWLKINKENQMVYSQIKLVFRNSNGDSQLQKEIWNDIKNRIDAEREVRVRKEREIPFLWKAAAVLIIIAFTWFGIRQFTGDVITPPKSEAQLVEKVSQKGEKRTIGLPDGTIVKLNAESTLSYPSIFSGDSRKVTLSGEAFFDVEENENAPFIIQTENLMIKVLGTSFNVRAYSYEDFSRVSVVSGKVAVGSRLGQAEVKEIIPTEMLTYIDSIQQASISNFDYEEIVGWKDNLIVIKEENIVGIFQMLSRWYGVEFTVNKVFDSNKDYSAKYDNPTLEAVLQGLSFVFDFTYKIEGKRVVIN